MPQTIQQLLLLARPKINNLDAELIIAHVLKKPREFVLANPEKIVSKYISVKVNKLFKQRKQNIPLAYLTEHKEFYGLDFKVNKNVLIPRPDTELVVSLVLARLKTYNLNLKTVLVDVGTGSGCIPISIIKTLNPTLPSPTRGGETNNSSPYKGEVGGGFAVYAIDISAKALTVAKANAKKHHVKASLHSAHVAGKIKFLHGDLLSPLLPLPNLPLIKGKETRRSFFPPLYKGRIKEGYTLIITANLPYLTPQQLKSEPSIKHEPRLALVAGKDGLKYYRQLLKQIAKITKCHLISVICYLEIDPSQTSSIKLLIKKHLPHAKITIHQDLSGKDRVVEINL
ncbi:MAG: Release factor glutamine methyltransferase [Candidatus Magasanikbacteria bacterium GW2011_GWC2_37_14]|uniref:Release factor glutamine methyltransferase n=1 Tax=Candidatus Magasanikbacteria bacterium GW2011_GWC2_37_14 TaxID=1619046 RepID=A0A0G0G788_9BACT|nr:MAG: Release factor glutamine methyltransferase [Candidatus Magasanikbacteria bacterium GW2011_GWC2_37_14]